MPTMKKLTQSSLLKSMSGMASNERRTEYAMTVINNPDTPTENKKEMAIYVRKDLNVRGQYVQRARDRIKSGLVGSKSRSNSKSNGSNNVDQSKFQRDSDGKKTFTFDWYINRTAGMDPDRLSSYGQTIMNDPDTSDEAKGFVRDHMSLFPERYKSNGFFGKKKSNSGSSRVEGVTLSEEEFNALTKFQKFIFSHFRSGTRNANAAYALKSLVNDETPTRKKSDIKNMVKKYPQWFFSGRSNGGQ